MQQLECITKPFCSTFMTGERSVKVIYRLEYGNNQLFARAAPYCPVAPPGAADTLVINYDPGAVSARLCFISGVIANLDMTTTC